MGKAMKRQSVFLVAFAAALLSTASYSPALAQDKSTTAPKPDATKPDTPKPEEKFKSPLTGKEATAGEKSEFDALVALYDKEQAALDAVEAAYKCGTDADWLAAKAKLNDARKAFSDAVYEYSTSYSDRVVVPNGTPMNQLKPNVKNVVFADMSKTEAAVAKASKYVHKKVDACPPKASETTPPAPPPPPPAKPEPPHAEEHWTTPLPTKPEDSEPRTEIGLVPPFVSPKSEAASFASAWDIVDSTFGLNYANFSPNVGNDGTQLGVTGSGLFSLGDNLGLDLNAGYNNVSAKGFHLDNWTANVSLAWRKQDWRFGPSFGYQNNSSAGFSASTYNVGGYFDYYHSDAFTFSGKGGGFWSSPGSNGYYVGGGLTGYLCPNFAARGSVDYTRWSAFGGSDETDYTLSAEYRFRGKLPLSLYGGYTYSEFAPGSSFHVNTLFLGLKYHFDDRFETLRDRDRGGTLGSSTYFAPLSLKF